MNTTSFINVTILGLQLGQRKPLFPERTVKIARQYLDEAGQIRLDTLLAEIVALEVAAYQERQAGQGLLQVLSAADMSAGRQQGRIGAPDRPVAAPVDLAEAVAVAQQAFADGLFFVFVDDAQVESLTELVALGEGSTCALCAW